MSCAFVAKLSAQRRATVQIDASDAAFATVEYVLASVELSYEQLAVDNTAVVYSVNVSFREILDARVASEELRVKHQANPLRAARRATVRLISRV
jgi:hypothetical protein